MNFQFVTKWATISCFSLVVISGLVQNSQAQQSRGKASFFCGTDGGKPATIARIPQPNGSSVLKTLIIWETNAFKGYPPEKRCPLVSQKFEDNQNTGDLKYIVSGKANTWPVLCASKDSKNYIVNCPDANVLMTLLPGDDSQEMIRKLGEASYKNSSTVLKHRARQVFVNNGNLQAINVSKWIKNSPSTE
ncbi:MAG: hypothetical protein F6K54_30880 [Okeania sp. SIO3B5]|uniref:COP23 domain-containing protein n=1 Tax=Okeania sp. SIO3B5 TaxID=2607811 RepID=UPI001400171D|nr:COP23 domain-containing protein [Okeania sp. SIO3B5]NEO57091.1 hypothetical protein [Okeania sp. SIO3B5]